LKICSSSECLFSYRLAVRLEVILILADHLLNVCPARPARCERAFCVLSPVKCAGISSLFCSGFSKLLYDRADLLLHGIVLRHIILGGGGVVAEKRAMECAEGTCRCVDVIVVGVDEVSNRRAMDDVDDLAGDVIL